MTKPAFFFGRTVCLSCRGIRAGGGGSTLDGGRNRSSAAVSASTAREVASTFSMCTASRLLTEWEFWAIADAVMKEHGEDAPLFVAGRMGALALDGDAAGVEAWTQVARRISKLTAGPEEGLHS